MRIRTRPTRNQWLIPSTSNRPVWSRVAFLALFQCLLLAVTTSVGVAQGPQPQGTPLTGAPEVVIPLADPDDPAAKPGEVKEGEPQRSLQYYVLPAPGGLYVYVPGQWGVVNINLQNPRDEAAEITCFTFFDTEPSLQYGRKIWMPPRSRMRTSHPILLPEKVTDIVINYHSVVESAGAVIREDTAQVRHGGSFLVTHKQQGEGNPGGERSITGIIQDLEKESDNPKNPPYDTVVACRVRLGQGRRVADQRDDFLPPEQESYNAVDQLVITSSRMLGDQAGLSAIRQWVGGGGRLWLMLDSLDPEILPGIFGDEWKGEYIDRIELPDVEILPARSNIGHPTVRTFYEKPVPLVRLVTVDEEVWYTVNGWPAAFWKTYGAGRVLVTTLGSEGWIRLNAISAKETADNKILNDKAARWGQEGLPPEAPTPAPPAPPSPQQRPPEDGRPRVDPAEFPRLPQMGGPGRRNPPGEESLFDPNESMARLAEEFFSRRPKEATTAEIVQEQAAEYIGYKIPTRNVVLGTLLGFVLGLGVVGVVLWKRERLELLGWSVPILALAAGAWLVWLGKESRQASDPLLAVVQIVHAVPGSHDFTSRGYGAVYSPEGKERILGLQNGGRLTPDMTGMSETNRRMEWTDLGKWEWIDLDLPPPQRSIHLLRSGTTRRPIIADATFNGDGLVGNLQLGDATGVSDAIIATDDGRLGVTLKGDGTFVATAKDVLAANQYLSSTFLTDEQNRRQRTVRKLLNAVDSVGGTETIQLLAWSDPWVEGLKLDPQRGVKGAAVVQIPLSIRRPAPGAPYLIPAPLLSFRNVRGPGPDGLTSSPIWDFSKNVGADRDQPGTAWFRFDPPVALEPLSPVSAHVRVDVSGPMGRLELAGWKNGKLEVLKEWIDPVGQLEFEVTDAEALKLIDGSVQLRLSAGDPSRPELTSRKEEGQDRKIPWKIQSLSVDLKAQSPADQGG